MTKSELYQEVQNLRIQLKVTDDMYPLDAIKLLEAHNILIDAMPMKTIGLRGIAIQKSCSGDYDAIILKAEHSSEEKNFYCAHEAMHLTFHRGANGKSFRCNENAKLNQNPFEEWQANAGAAELLVPYRLFIPAFVSLSRKNAKISCHSALILELAQEFHVSGQVISNRIQSLNYEIAHYLQYGDIAKIPIVSANQLNRLGWKGSAIRSYCTNCLARVGSRQQYCQVCGKQLLKNTPETYNMENTSIGVGYLNYSGIKVDERCKAKICPVCGNEETSVDGEYCQICGTYIVNMCQHEYYDSEYSDQPYFRSCSDSAKVLPGNARHCPYCGSDTTFLIKHFLQPWDKTNLPFVEIEDTEDLPY